MEVIPQSFMQEPIFRKLGKVAQYGALSEKDRKAYDESLKAYRDAYAIAETERAEGRAEGIAEGRAEGIARVALAMKFQGMDHEQISKLTGLTTDEINRLS